MATHRVLVCSNVYPPHFIGGAELIAHQYAKTLARLGHDVLVFAGETRARHRRHASWRDSYDGIDVHRVRLAPEDFSAEFANFSHPDLDRDFAAIVEEFRPTVVHCHNLPGLTLGILHQAKALGIPTVVTLHDHWGFCHRNTLLTKAGPLCRDHRRCAECLAFITDGDDRRIPIQLRNDFMALELGLADLLVAPSRYLADAYIQAGFSPDQLHVIPYGIDVERFASLRGRPTPSRPRFTFVGHFGEHKGLRVLCQALAHLEPFRDRFDLSLVGRGPLLPAIRQEVIDRGWERSVHFPGQVDHMGIEGVYHQTDVLLLPSIWPENQPVSITEAMAAGIPVIASRIGGIPELVEHGATGFLVEAGDPIELAAAMARFVDDPALVRDLGDQAVDRIKDNDIERRAGDYVARYGATHPRAIGRPVVACVGRHFSPVCAAAVDALSREQGSPRFVMSEWVDDAVLASASVIWVVDEEVRVHEPPFTAGVPLLVPAASEALRQLCVNANCGLYYADAEQAVACLELLLQNGSVRSALGENAARLATGGSP